MAWTSHVGFCLVVILDPYILLYTHRNRYGEMKPRKKRSTTPLFRFFLGFPIVFSNCPTVFSNYPMVFSNFLFPPRFPSPTMAAQACHLDPSGGEVRLLGRGLRDFAKAAEVFARDLAPRCDEVGELLWGYNLIGMKQWDMIRYSNDYSGIWIYRGLCGIIGMIRLGNHYPLGAPDPPGG